MKHWVIMMGMLGTLVSCGAKTGLRLPDASVDASRDSFVDAVSCTTGRFPLSPTLLNMILVIDRSGSMNQDIDGIGDQSRWQALEQGLRRSFVSNDQLLVAGKFFPDVIDSPRPDPAEACRVSTTLEVGFSANGMNNILNVFNTTEPVGGTPTFSALSIASGALRGISNRTYIVLATDGEPNCNENLDPFICECTNIGSGMDCMEPQQCLDDDRTINLISGIFSNDGIPTIVIGIEDPFNPASSLTLNRMARAGGRPRPGSVPYYSATSSDDLNEALTEISRGITQCSYRISSVPPSDEGLRIQLNGTVIPRDDANGWSWYDRNKGELEFRGTACMLASSATVREGVVGECPDM